MSEQNAPNLHDDAQSDKMHMCLLDHAGEVRATNYPLDDQRALPLPALIRLAYGVDAHPDMPDAIYKRMETRLETGAGSAGFYLCQSQNGEPFWISVSFYNTPNGRVVCHFPVFSPKLAYFERLFAHLKKAETDGLTPQESAVRLGGLMVNDGIEDYRSLAKAITVVEIQKRDAGYDRPQYRSVLILDAILKALCDIDGYAKRIDAVSASSRIIPYQLSLQASRLEGGRGPLSVIANNHKELTETLLAVTAELQSASSTEVGAVLDAIAYLAQSYYATELLGNDQIRCCDTDEEAQSTRAELEAVITDCALQITTLLADIDRSILKLRKVCNRIRRALSAMEMTRVMCKIERSRHASEAEGLIEIENQLDNVQINLLKWMIEIKISEEDALMLAEGLKKATQSEVIGVPATLARFYAAA